GREIPRQELGDGLGVRLAHFSGGNADQGSAGRWRCAGRARGGGRGGTAPRRRALRRDGRVLLTVGRGVDPGGGCLLMPEHVQGSEAAGCGGQNDRCRECDWPPPAAAPSRRQRLARLEWLGRAPTPRRAPPRRPTPL